MQVRLRGCGSDSIAQLVEQYTFNVWVLGSNPSGITRVRRIKCLHPQGCKWEISSVGLEHCLYTARVGGSSPSSPTMKKLAMLILVLLPFMDTPNKKQNRCIDRLNGAQIEDAIITLNHLQKPIK